MRKDQNISLNHLFSSWINYSCARGGISPPSAASIKLVQTIQSFVETIGFNPETKLSCKKKNHFSVSVLNTACCPRFWSCSEKIIELLIQKAKDSKINKNRIRNRWIFNKYRTKNKTEVSFKKLFSDCFIFKIFYSGYF